MSTIEKALAKQQAKSNQNIENNVDKPKVATDTTTDRISAKAPVAETDVNIEKKSQNKQLNVDKEDLNKRGYLIDSGSRQSIKDEFRQIKRKLLNNAFGVASKTLNHPNLVMISSSKPNEGKTFVSINLALSIALEQDKTVLIIDADVLRPSITRELGIPDSPGLIEYLRGQKDSIGDIIYNTNIDKLKLIPAGEPHHLSNELLASDRMADLAKELSVRYPDRIVLFDCPPLIGVTETLVLANLMGQALVVVEESKTKLDDIKKATENLNEDLALGLVVNKAIRSHKDMYGYYGYGYAK
jgi:receptor protein-tyrosine kinase